MGNASFLKPDDVASIAFWKSAMIIGPVVALALPLAATWLLGGYDRIDWFGRVTFFQSLGILSPMSFPFGAYFHAFGRWNRARAHASRAWPTVPGVVETSNVEGASGQGWMPAFHRLMLSYRYTVEGVSHQGNRIQFGPSYLIARETIERLARKYPAGAQVSVHYDPNDAGTSVIETSDDMALQYRWLIWLFFAIPIVYGVLATIANWRS